MTLEDHEKEANTTFRGLNGIPSLLRRGISAPSPAPVPARGCSCALTMSATGGLSREPGPPPPTTQPNSALLGSQAVAKAAVADFRQPRPLRLAPEMIDGHFTQWSEEKDLKPAPFLLSTNSVTLCLPVYR